jgi:hypothetical protein
MATGFQRSILWILPARTYLDYLLRVLPHRISLWEQKLEHSGVKDATFIVNSLEWDRLAPFMLRLSSAAIRSNKLELWGCILDATVSGLGMDRRVLEVVAFFGACNVFSFRSIVARLEQSLENRGFHRLILVASIPEYDGMVTEWRIGYAQHILRSTIELGEEEVTVLVEVLKEGDLRFVRDM